jgi:hypothetical protein
MSKLRAVWERVEVRIGSIAFRASCPLAMEMLRMMAGSATLMAIEIFNKFP